MLENEDMRESEPGKWIVGAGLLTLGFIITATAISFTVNVDSLYSLAIFPGIYLMAVIIYDQVIKNLRLKTTKAH